MTIADHLYVCRGCGGVTVSEKPTCPCKEPTFRFTKDGELPGKPSLLVTPVARTVESRVMPRLLALLDKKQLDYGPDNIRRHGQLGVVVRLNDKTSRIANLLKKQLLPSNESILDSWDDVANYGIIGGMVARGEWPEK